MVIKNTTILTKEEAAQEVITLSRKYYYKKYIFSGILILLGIVVLIMVALMENANDSQIIGFLFLAFGLTLTIINTISIGTIKKKLKKQNPALLEHGMINHFTFKEESFQLVVQIGSSTSKYEFPYNEITGITEYDDFISFAISAQEVYICKKSAFQSEKELNLFFYGLSKHKTKIRKKLSKNTQK